MKPILILLFIGHIALHADGPLGPPVNNRLMEAQRLQAAQAKRDAVIRFQREAEERAQQAAALQAQRDAAVRAQAEAKAAELRRRAALRENATAQLVRANLDRARARADRARLARLADEWRVVNGSTQNMTWTGWRPITGRVVETHQEGLRVLTSEGDTILLLNYGRAMADGESVSQHAAHVGIYRFKEGSGATSSIRKYDCGESCSPPATWIADAPKRKLAEENLRLAEDAKRRADEEAVRLEEERWAQADEAETEEERGRERKHQAALRAQEEGTRQRVLAYHHQQATNGLGSFQYELGKRYLNGDGVPQDKDLARHWLRSACTNGLSEATNLLGKVQ